MFFAYEWNPFKVLNDLLIYFLNTLLPSQLFNLTDIEVLEESGCKEDQHKDHEGIVSIYSNF